MNRELRLAGYLAAVAVVAAIANGCGGSDVPGEIDVDVRNFGSPAGYWEGEGTLRQTPMDGVRTLTRNADFTFWFSLDPQGSALGEITLIYESVLTVRGLPEMSTPGVGGASASFKPEVGGEITDPDPTRIFPLVGILDEDGLVLGMVPGEEPRPIQFTIRADPGVSAGFDVGGGGNVGFGGEGAGTMTYAIEMVPFTPFAGSDIARVEKRPGGPHAAHFELTGENKLAIEWNAVQKSSVTQSIEVTSEMRDALDALAQDRR